jgi:hypothetical protein
MPSNDAYRVEKGLWPHASTLGGLCWHRTSASAAVTAKRLRHPARHHAEKRKVHDGGLLSPSSPPIGANAGRIRVPTRVQTVGEMPVLSNCLLHVNSHTSNKSSQLFCRGPMRHLSPARRHCGLRQSAKQVEIADQNATCVPLTFTSAPSPG